MIRIDNPSLPDENQNEHKIDPQALLKACCHGTIQDQQKELKEMQALIKNSSDPAKTYASLQKLIANRLTEHSSLLTRMIDSEPTTKNLPEDTKQEFIQSQMDVQKQLVQPPAQPPLGGLGISPPHSLTSSPFTPHTAQSLQDAISEVDQWVSSLSTTDPMYPLATSLQQMINQFAGQPNNSFSTFQAYMLMALYMPTKNTNPEVANLISSLNNNPAALQIFKQIAGVDQILSSPSSNYQQLPGLFQAFANLPFQNDPQNSLQPLFAGLYACTKGASSYQELQYAANTYLLSSIWKTNPPTPTVAPDLAPLLKDLGFQIPIQPPATEQTLAVPGGSLEVLNVPGVPTPLYIPIGHSLAAGSPSEAYGYYMRNAVAAGDETLYKELLQSYFYFCNQTAGGRAAFSGPNEPNPPPAFGLIGWSFGLNGLYPPGNLSVLDSASDADEDIINSMITALQKFPDLQNYTVTDPWSGVLKGSYPPEHQSMTLKDLALAAGRSFVGGTYAIPGNPNAPYGDIGDTALNGIMPAGQTLGLAMSEEGNSPACTDYCDPTMMMNLYNFLNANYTGSDKSEVLTRLKTGLENTMAAVEKVVQGQNWWVPYSMNGTGSAQSFGAEQTRILMRLAEFVGNPANESFDPGVYQNALTVLKNLVVNNILPNSSLQSDGSYMLTGGGGSCGGGMFTGPLYCALVALQKAGVTIPNGDQVLAQVKMGLTHDLSVYDNLDDTDAWSAAPTWGYFNINLALLGLSIANSLNPSIPFTPITSDTSNDSTGQITTQLFEWLQTLSPTDPAYKLVKDLINTMPSVQWVSAFQAMCMLALKAPSLLSPSEQTIANDLQGLPQSDLDTFEKIVGIDQAMSNPQQNVPLLVNILSGFTQSNLWGPSASKEELFFDNLINVIRNDTTWAAYQADAQKFIQQNPPPPTLTNLLQALGL
jgi:hypothetical protein